jgi:hypothetical protein
MKLYENVEVNLWPQKQTEMSGQPHALTLLLRKEVLTPTGLEAMWECAQKWNQMMWWCHSVGGGDPALEQSLTNWSSPAKNK